MGGVHRYAPLVSCLMVTLPSAVRLRYLKRSLAAYRDQTYPARELIVVLDRGTPEACAAVRRSVEELGQSDIRIIEPQGALTLGALRNIAWGAATGDFICQWDDDDMYHPTRIAAQMGALEGLGGVSTCLEEVMQFFPASRRVYLTNWRATPPTAMPATLFCRSSARVRYPEEGPEATLGEDLSVLLQLQALGGFHAQAGAPHLYVYVSHGQNLCGADHHQMIADLLAVSKGLLRRREAELREGLAAFDFGEDDVVVEGSNGLAFVIAGRDDAA
jgi:glycosyltransferase involved in cell wall biosynthesis